MVTPMRFELMASGLGILRSILLSYGVGAGWIAKLGPGENQKLAGPLAVCIFTTSQQLHPL